MATFKGECGDERKVGVRFGARIPVSVNVDNKGDCPVRIVLRNADKVVKKLTIDAGESDSVDACDVDKITIRCAGEKDDGKCKFSYEIYAGVGKVRGKCGSAEAAATVSFDQKVTLEAHVINWGDCDVRIVLSKPIPGTFPLELEPVGKATVKPGDSRTFSRDGVTDARISCLGDEDDGKCNFRYTFHAS